MTYYRRPGPAILIAEESTSLPDVVDETSGVELAPLTVGITSGVLNDTARGLPGACTLYGRPSDGDTVTVPGPVSLKGFVDGTWYPLGLLNGGDAIVAADTSGYIADVTIPPSMTRIAAENGGQAITGGTFSLELVAVAAFQPERIQ